MKSNVRVSLVVSALLACTAPAVVPAGAETLGSGPTIVTGYSGDEDKSGVAHDLAIASVGWRWRRDGAQRIDDFMARASIDFSWAVEPLIGGVFGDSHAFEASVVPYFQLRPLGWEGVMPYFEGGIGLAYTSLDDYGLGSQVQFCDNVGLGLAFGNEYGTRWTIGYRFRHLSNAGLWGDDNEGLNAHLLAVTIE